MEASIAMTNLKQEDYRGYEIYIEQEMNWEIFDPRKSTENLGTMVCFHKEYPLGDEHDFNDSTELMDYMESEEVALYLPLFLFDHGNITMRVRGFRDADPDAWDWGQVGYIYVTHEDLEKEYGEDNFGAIAKAERVLKAEVEEYGNFIAGEVYYITILDPENELIESLSGIIGTDQLEDAEVEATAIVDGTIERGTRKLLSEEKYIARKQCPNCKRPLSEVAEKLYEIQRFSSVLKAEESHTSPYGYITQKVECTECKYEWREYYELTLVGYGEV